VLGSSGVKWPQNVIAIDAARSDPIGFSRTGVKGIRTGASQSEKNGPYISACREIIKERENGGASAEK